VTDPDPRPGRSSDLVLARVHLRLGSLALARAELEALAGRDGLDADGLLDLAEVRWRTGDLAGAGEAAGLILEGADGLDAAPEALIIAAEAALLRGRPTEARGYADRAMELAGDALDGIFAGMPRGAVWPADTTDLPPTTPTLFETPIAGAAAHAVAAASTPDGHGPADAAPGPVTADLRPGSPPAGVTESAPLALWSATEIGADHGAIDAAAGEAGADLGASDPGLPAGDAALHLGIAALAAGSVPDAAIQLGLALRLTPALAPAVLDAIEGRSERELALVRGDAYRLVGRELEARQAFAGAASPALPADITQTPSSEGDPA
jgi:tetratricopeptide (TPR) repeat protein